VDHGLRKGSGPEAREAAARATALGVEAVVRDWHSNGIGSGIQAAARDARYGLMLDWCRANDVGDLLLGHHRDDQAATVLMRLRHGSGISGLSAMQEVSLRDGIRLVRPMLHLKKRDLTDWLDAQGIIWTEDPSNASDAFERNRVNRWIAEQDPDGVLTERLARLAERSARADEALEKMAEDAWLRVARETDSGVTLDLMGWRAVPREIALRLTARAISNVTGNTPRLAGLEDAFERLKSQSRINLAGATVSIGKTVLTVQREPQRR